MASPTHPVTSSASSATASASSSSSSPPTSPISQPPPSAYRTTTAVRGTSISSLETIIDVVQSTAYAYTTPLRKISSHRKPVPGTSPSSPSINGDEIVSPSETMLDSPSSFASSSTFVSTSSSSPLFDTPTKQSFYTLKSSKRNSMTSEFEGETGRKSMFMEALDTHASGLDFLRPPEYVLGVHMPSSEAEGEESGRNGNRQGSERTLPGYTITATQANTFYPPPPSPPGTSPSSPTEPDSDLSLPTYAPASTTEPHTLSRSLFLWGFLCPLMWVLGIIILWVDLKVSDEYLEGNAQNPDVGSEEQAIEGRTSGVVESMAEEKRLRLIRERQVLEEKVVILRKAEIRWSTRCAIALCLEVALVGIIVAVIIGVKAARG